MNSFSRGLAYIVFSRKRRSISSKPGTGTPAVCPLRPTNTHTALMLATFAFMRKWPTVIHFLLTLAGVIGIASMVETFCHLRTPVFMSIMRGYDGLLIGALFGVLLIIAVRFMMYVTQWFQAREVDHE